MTRWIEDIYYEVLKNNSLIENLLVGQYGGKIISCYKNHPFINLYIHHTRSVYSYIRILQHNNDILA